MNNTIVCPTCNYVISCIGCCDFVCPSCGEDLFHFLKEKISKSEEMK